MNVAALVPEIERRRDHRLTDLDVGPLGIGASDQGGDARDIGGRHRGAASGFIATAGDLDLADHVSRQAKLIAY